MEKLRTFGTIVLALTAVVFILAVCQALLATFVWDSEPVVVVWFWLLCLPVWLMARVIYKEWREK